MAIARRSPIAAAAHAKGFVLFCNPIEEHPSILPGPNTERGESSRALAAVSNFSPPGGSNVRRSEAVVWIERRTESSVDDERWRDYARGSERARVAP